MVHVATGGYASTAGDRSTRWSGSETLQLRPASPTGGTTAAIRSLSAAVETRLQLSTTTYGILIKIYRYLIKTPKIFSEIIKSVLFNIEFCYQACRRYSWILTAYKSVSKSFSKTTHFFSSISCFKFDFISDLFTRWQILRRDIR